MQFDRTKGFPGERPHIGPTVDVLCLPETKHSDMHLASVQGHARKYGLNMHHNPCVFIDKGGRSGGS
jgi:hypothetical protein